MGKFPLAEAFRKSHSYYILRMYTGVALESVSPTDGVPALVQRLRIAAAQLQCNRSWPALDKKSLCCGVLRIPAYRHGAHALVA